MLFNDRLDTILNQFGSDIHGLPSFDEYSQTIKEAKRNESKQTVINRTKLQLKSLHDQLIKDIEDANSKIANIKTPNLNNPDPMLKVYGAVESNSVMLVVQDMPSNIETIIKDAANRGRMEFVFEVINGILSSKNVSENYRRSVSLLKEAIYEKTGLTALEKTKRELETLFIEAKDNLDLISKDPEMFEAKVSMKSRVVRAMAERGQFEGESIFIKKA